MRLKWATTVCLVFGILLMFSWPFFLGPRPPRNAPKLELAEYAQKYLLLFGITAFVFLLTAVFALLLVRQTRRDYLEQTRVNLQELVEGTLRDHADKS